MKRALTLAAVCVITACYSPRIPSGALSCGEPGDVCPNGFSCIRGYCDSNGAEADQGTDLGITVDAAMVDLFGATRDLKSADDLANAPTDNQCYYTSVPMGSNHCVQGPCSLSSGTIACSAGSFVNYVKGTAIFAVLGGSVSTIYADGTMTFPTCTGGAMLGSEQAPAAGDFIETNLQVGSVSASDLAKACGTGKPPAFSASQCYYESYPAGSKACITAPCSVTNPTTAIAPCVVSGSLIVQSGSVIYQLGSDGTINDVYPDIATTFSTCTGGSTPADPSGVPGSYYATGLIVGQATAAELAGACTTIEQ